MKKLTLLLLISSALFSTGYGQEIYTKIEDRIMATDYIFEGVVLKTQPYKTVDQKKIYTSNAIQITKIFKGGDSLSCGTVELITEGGELPDVGEEPSHALKMKVGDQGLFLCSENFRELPQASYFPFSVPTKMAAKFEWQSFIKYLYEYNDLKAYDLWGVYDSLSQLYNLTELLTQIPYTSCDDTHLLSPPAPPVQPYHPDPMPVYSRADIDSASVRMQRVLNRPHRMRTSRSTVTLSYNMSNVITTGTNPKYMEFDINLSDNGGGDYLVNASPHLLLPSGFFADSVVANGQIQVTAGPLISDTTQYYPPTPVDISANELAFAFSSVLYPTHMSELTSSYQKAAHVKIQIANCGAGGVVSFTDQTDMLNASYYSTTPDTTAGITPYDAVDASQTVSTTACSEVITGFSPASVNGGVGDTLYIRGYQFGSSPGTGGLFFCNADNPNAGPYTPLDSLDYISWSDTLIVVRVPSVDSGQSSLPIGSGPFRLITANGDLSTMSIPLTVFYSLINAYDTATKTKRSVYQINKSGNGGYQFYVDTSVSHNPAIYGCVKKAINDWVCATGINFSILRDTVGISDTTMVDGINLITFGPQSPTHFATCTNYSHICGTGVVDEGYFKEKDIVISNDTGIIWFTDTSGTQPVPYGATDLYHIMLHELGHGVGHNHVIDPNAIMYYAAPIVPAGGLPANQRIVNIRVDASASDGGVREVDNSSLSSNFISGCHTIPMTPEYICVISNSINYIKPGVANIKVYPNPFDDLLNIESDDPITSVSLNSIDGKLVGNWAYDSEMKIAVKLPNFVSGFYLINIRTQSGFAIKKLIHE